MSEQFVHLADDPLESRYELHVAGELAGLIAYRIEPGALALVHTEVAPAFDGQGLGSKLVAFALDDIRDRDLKVVPACPFVAAYVKRHPEYADIVAEATTPGR